MKRLTALLTLTCFLAACGGTAPPPEQPPITEPSPPTPPVIPIEPVEPTPPEQPISDVPYYGEWRVVFTTDTGAVSFTHSLNITERAPEPLVNGGLGLQDFCIEDTPDPCDTSSTFSSGFGFIGGLPLDDGTTPLSISIFTQYRQSETPDLKIFSVENIVIQEDGQGRDSFSVPSAWTSRGDIISLGTISATLVGPPRLLDPISAYIGDTSIQEFKTVRER